MSGAKKNCGTCAYGDIPRGPSGRIRPSMAGKCTFLINVSPVQPAAVKVEITRSAIWSSFGAECPAWIVRPA
jgi:hypothetical protein